MINELENDVEYLKWARPFLIKPLNETTTKKEFNYSSCIKEPLVGKYVSGEILPRFIKDVTKEQVDELLSSHNLSSEGIEFRDSVRFRVDFIGNMEGFVDYLSQKGFTGQDNSNSRYFLFKSQEDIKCSEANNIFYSYPHIFIDKVYCFRSVWGVVEVPKGEEKEWICELKKSEIVENVDLKYDGLCIVIYLLIA